jgi:hypothetical protein
LKIKSLVKSEGRAGAKAGRRKEDGVDLSARSEEEEEEAKGCELAAWRARDREIELWS